MNNYINAEYKEVDKDKEITYTPLYLNCKQVAQILEENESTIRYWVKQFDDILNIQVSNMVKRYTKTDVDNLLFIKKLIREDGLTIKQTHDYCNKKGFNDSEDLVDSSNPLVIKTLVKAIMSEMNDNLKNMKSQIVNEIKNELDSNNNELQDKLSFTVDEVINDKMNELIEENEKLKEIINNYNSNVSEDLKAIRQENDKIHQLQQKLADRKEEYENNKGFFKRLFGR